MRFFPVLSVAMAALFLAATASTAEAAVACKRVGFPKGCVGGVGAPGVGVGGPAGVGGPGGAGPSRPVNRGRPVNGPARL